MQKTFIIFAVIILSSSAAAQLKLREYQTISENPANAAPTETNSSAAANFVELNALGVKKALVEKDFLQVQHDIGDVFNDAFNGGEFVHRAIDLDRGDRRAFERR